jgi:hypothetical protein
MEQNIAMTSIIDPPILSLPAVNPVAFVVADHLYPRFTRRLRNLFVGELLKNIRTGSVRTHDDVPCLRACAPLQE